MNKKGFTAVEAIIGVLVAAFIIAVCITCGLCWQYSITAWGNHFHKAIHIKFWQCMLLGFIPFIGQASLPVAAGTWIVMMFI